MTAYLRPRDLDEALEARAAHPDWMVLAGGTDLMVNANHRAAPVGILEEEADPDAVVALLVFDLGLVQRTLQRGPFYL